MSYRGKPSVSPRQPVLPPVSCRTLQHPSFLPLYITNPTGVPLHLQGGNQTVYHMIPGELFYSDPTMGSGMRIWNTHRIRAFSPSQLNAPQPIMSACEGPPNHPDPFRSGPHPTRDLGSLSWTIRSGQPQRVVVQLTQEEDQAVTNLLKLHHQEATEENVPAAPLDPSGPTGSSLGCLTAFSPIFVDAQSPELRRRRQQPEAALLSGFNQQHDDLLLCPSADSNSDGKISGWFMKDESQTSDAALRSVNLKKTKRSEGRTLTDLEENAVQMLLSLADAASSQTLQ